MKHLRKHFKFFAITCILSTLISSATSYADLNEELVDAAHQGYTTTIKSLLANGADVNAKNNLGYTALIMASTGGHAETVKALLAHGADVNTKDKYGSTALMMASIQGHYEVIKALLTNGADVNAKDKNGVTALMYASLKGHAETVKALLAHGADVNTKDKAVGRTALTHASTNGHAEIVKVLLAHGADVNTKDDFGFTPIAAASIEGFPGIVELLKKSGAEAGTYSTFTKANGDGWKFYHETHYGGYHAKYYYDKESISHPSKNIVRVRIKLIPSKEAKEKMIQAWKKGGVVSTEGYENYEYSLTIYELNCADRTHRTLSNTDYDRKGTVLRSVVPDTSPKKWFNFSASWIDKLFVSVCPKIKR